MFQRTWLIRCFELLLPIVVLVLALAASPAFAQLPDLTAAKTNDTGGVGMVGVAFTWTITVANSGPGDFSTPSLVPLVSDFLPDANITYGTPTATLGTGATGLLSCSINATAELLCFNLGAFTLSVGGSFTVSFTATPAASGTYANPRPGGNCNVDPGNIVAETDDDNNDCADSVSVGTGAVGPDLTVAKSNDVGGTTEIAAGAFSWSLQVANGGDQAATFASGEAIVLDNLPNASMDYGSPAITGPSGISGTGTINCSIVSSNLTCVASGGSVVLAATTGAFTVVFDATPSAVASFANPRVGGACTVDADGNVAEGDEDNNACSDTVVVGGSPDLVTTKTNDTMGAGIKDQPFTWSIKVDNIGSGDYVESTFPILGDNLPDSNMVYGTPSVTVSSGLTGALVCTIVSSTLSCTPSSSVTLAAGGSFTVSFTATPSAVGTFDNPRAGTTCAADPLDQTLEVSDANNACADTVVVTTGVLGPDLTVAKTNDVGDATEIAAGAFTWSLQVANGGDQDATFARGETILTDNLPNASLVYGTPAITAASGISGAGTISCSIATSDLSCIAGGGPVTLTAETGSFTVSFDATPTAADTFVNPRTGGACSVDPGGAITEGDEGNNTCADTVAVSDSPDLVATKTNDTAGVGVIGSPFTWSIEVENIGAADFVIQSAFSVLLVDSLPDSGMSYSAPTITAMNGLTGPLGCSIDASSVLVCSASTDVTLAAGGSFTVSFSATPSAAGTFANPRAGGSCRADAADAELETDETNNDCADTVEVPPVAALSLTKTDTPDPVTAGNTVMYDLAVTNAGPDAAAAVVAYDVLPEGTTFDDVASDPACTQPAGLVGLRTALDGASTTPPSGSVATGRAGLVLDTGTNELRFALAVAGVTNTITAASLRLTGGALVHTLYQGAPPAFDDANPIAGTIQLSQSEADALQVASSHVVRVDTDANPGGEIAGTVAAATQAPVVCALGTIAASGNGSAQIVTAVGAGQASTALDNLALVDASTDDPNQVDLPAGALRGAAAATSTAVVAAADLAIVKSDSMDPVTGSGFGYTLTVTNAGPSDARNVVATDVLPAGLVFDSSADPCTDSSGTVTCDFGTVVAGALASRSFMVTLDAPSSPLVMNTATVTSDEPDPDPGDNSDTEETVLDALAPTVTGLDSVGGTGDGTLADCETATVNVQQLLATFSEPVRDPPGNSDADDVTNPDNVQLIAAGVDRTFQTAQCGGVQGDDQLVAVSSIAYDNPTRTATVDYGAPLGDDLYRLLVCDGVQDLVGNPLDGDADGTGGDDFERLFRIDADNLFANGHFDCDLTGWSVRSTNPSEIVWASDDHQGSGDSGSVALDNLTASTHFLVGQCAEMPQPGVAHTLRARFRLSASATATLGLARGCAFYDSPACTGNELDAAVEDMVAVDTVGAWLPITTALVPPGLALSASCSFLLTAADGDNFDARLDFLSLTMNPGSLFVDGFESGTTSAWTVTVRSE